MNVRPYVVMPGDSLSKIAKIAGTDVQSLMAVNQGNITDPNMIMVGQQINIPETLEMSAPATPAAPAVETVNIVPEQQVPVMQQAPAEASPQAVVIDQAAIEAAQKAAAEAQAAAAAQAALEAQQAEALRKEQEALALQQQQAAEAQAAALAAAQMAAQTATFNPNVLNSNVGTIEGPSGKETYYDLKMDGCFGNVAQADLLKTSMQNLGLEFPRDFHVREDGVKCLGDYVLVAANLDVRPKGTIVNTSLGKGIVVDTGAFAATNPTQLDIATNWTHHRNS